MKLFFNLILKKLICNLYLYKTKITVYRFLRLRLYLYEIVFKPYIKKINL